MNLSPEMLQFFILFSISIPFSIPLFRKYAKIIPLFQIFSGIFFLSIYWFSGNTEILTTVFGGHHHFKGIELLFNFNSSIFLVASYSVFFSVILYTFSEEYDWKYYFLLNLLLSDLTCLFMVNDLFNIYVTLELLSLLCYLLISYKNTNLQIWSSLKYMILGAVSFNIYLLGVAMIYNSTGSLNLTILKNYDISPLPILLIFFTLLVKSGFFFFSMWLPLAQSEAESQISAILSATVDKAGIFLILRLNQVFNFQEISILLTSAAIITILFGTFFSLRQKNIKLILAFSTMSQMGIILLGNSIASVFYAFSHSIIKTILFLTSGFVFSKYKTKNILKQNFKVPVVFFLSSWIAYLSISGLPFFLGSYYKHNIISELSLPFKFVLIAATLGSIISIGRFVFKLRLTNKIKTTISKSISLAVLSIIGLTLGIISTLNYLKPYYFIETFLIFFVGILCLYFLKKRINYRYNSNVFKLSNALYYYWLILFMIVLINILF